MIKPLTSFRFVFALMVFLHHLHYLANSPNELIRWMHEHVFEEGYIGVSFFFVLSGFILALNYQERILESSKSVSKFLVARFARIYPLHFVTMLAAIPLLNAPELCCDTSKKLALANLAGNLTLLHGFFPELGSCCYLNGPSWSISVEMFFYSLFPLLIFLLRGVVDHSWRLVSLLLAITGVVFFGIWQFSDVVPNNFFYVNPFVRSLDFLMGIVLFNLYRLSKFQISSASWSLLEIACLALFVLFFSIKHHVPDSYRDSIYYWIPVCFMIYIFAFQSGWISKIMSIKPLEFLGEISFAFYLIHQLVLRYISFIFGPWGLTEIERTGWALLVSLVLSFISYKLLELPTNKLLRGSKFVESIYWKATCIVYRWLPTRG